MRVEVGMTKGSGNSLPARHPVDGDPHCTLDELIGLAVKTAREEGVYVASHDNAPIGMRFLWSRMRRQIVHRVRVELEKGDGSDGKTNDG